MDTTSRKLILPGIIPLPLKNHLQTSMFGLAALILAFLVISEALRLRHRLPAIKGPLGYPIFGNLLQLSPDPPERLRQWGQKYGGVYQIMMGNRPVVVFTSMQAARDVFVGQGGSLVDRPTNYTFHGVMSSVASTIGTTPWSESTKRRRKAAASAMNKVSTASYTPLINATSQDFIQDLLEKGRAGQVSFSPKRSILNTVLDLTMTVNYGTRLPKEEALFAELIEVEDQVSHLRSVTGSFQDYIPLLQWNPINLKSSNARSTNSRRLAYLNRFSEEHKEQMNLGKDKPCIQGNILQDPDHKFTEVELMSINMSMVSGGLDTLANTMAWTVGTLARRVDIQEIAYSAIVDVHGADSWGEVQGDNDVPYITALVKESLRYFSVLRLSLPRRAWRDIEYNGLFIPKGTTVYLNAWGCNRDSSYFGPTVNEYRPERWLEKKNERMDHAAFGIGTRMCAGNHLASRQLYIMILRLLWAYKIELSDDPSENAWGIHPLQDSAEPDQFAARPPVYKLRFVPRNEKALRKQLDHVLA